MIQQGEIPDCYGIECCDECAIDCPFYMDCEADSPAKPYHVLDGGKVRCHVCGALLRWVDAAETEIGYSCEDHILEEDDEPAGGERR